MKCTLSKQSLAAMALLFAWPIAQATPLQKTDVAADPVWLAHVDVDRLRTTSVGQFIISETENPEVQAKLAAFQAMFRFDLKTQLHGLTLYGMGQSPEQGVLLVYADFDADHLSTLAKGANEYKSADHNRHVIHSWIDDSRKFRHGGYGRTYAATQGSRLLIFGQSEAVVANALDVLDQSAANLTASKAFPVPEGGSSFFTAAAQNLKLGDSDPHAAVFRLSKTIRVEVGEEQKRLNASLQLIAGDEEIAKQIASVAQGLISLMKLQKEHPEANKLADALTLKQDSVEVLVNLSLSAPDVIDVIKAHHIRQEKKDE